MELLWDLQPEHHLALSVGPQSDYLEPDLRRWLAEPCPPRLCWSPFRKKTCCFLICEQLKREMAVSEDASKAAAPAGASFRSTSHSEPSDEEWKLLLVCLLPSWPRR